MILLGTEENESVILDLSRGAAPQRPAVPAMPPLPLIIGQVEDVPSVHVLRTKTEIHALDGAKQVSQTTVQFRATRLQSAHNTGLRNLRSDTELGRSQGINASPPSIELDRSGGVWWCNGCRSWNGGGSWSWSAQGWDDAIDREGSRSRARRGGEASSRVMRRPLVLESVRSTLRLSLSASGRRSRVGW